MHKVSETTSEHLQAASSPSQHIHPRLLTFIAFQRTCGTVTSAYLNLISILVPLHTFAGYLLLSSHSLSSYLVDSITLMRQSAVIVTSLQITAYLLTILLIICPFLADLKHKGKIWFTTLKRVIGIYPLLVKVVFALTGIILYLQFYSSLAAFILASFLSLFNIIVIGNYHQKKEENYKSSERGAIILQLGFIFNIIGNGALVHFGGLTIFCYFAAALGLLYLIWHLVIGFKLFLHSTARVIHLFLSTLIISCALNYTLLIFPVTPVDTFDFIDLTILFVCVGFFLSVYEEKRRFWFENPQKIIKNNPQILKDNELSLSLLLEDSDNNKNKENLLVGMIAHHLAINCPYEHCWSHQENVYDPLLKHSFNSRSLVREKDSVLRFYIKCLYERALEEHGSKELMLDYCEFAISEMSDFSRHTFILTELSLMTSLGFLERIKLTKLRLVLLDQSEAFNRIIHGGKIELLEVLNSEDIYQLAVEDISRYCKRSQEVWKDTTQKEVNITDLKRNLAELFEAMPRIDAYWNQLSKFLHIQKQWRYVYLNYALFLKNEKVKNKDNSVNDYFSDDINEGSPLNDHKDQAIADHIFFDKKAAIVMTYLDSEGLKIDRVSNSFEPLTLHKASDVINCSLNLILPKDIREGKHDFLVRNFVEGQHTTDQHVYNIKYTHFVNKLDEDVPALVIFKIYVELTSVEVVKLLCLIKSTKKDSEMAIADIESAEIYRQASRELFDHETSWSLNPALNIFLKDENLQPSRHNTPISVTMWMGRLLTFSLVMMMIILPIKLRLDIEEMKNNSQMLRYFIHTYDLPITLGEKYYFSALNILNPSMMRSIIRGIDTEFQLYENSPYNTKTIFNKHLNRPKMYLPFTANAANQNLSYNQIDLFYLIVSNRKTLSNSPSIQTSTLEFQQFHSYLTPSFDSMMNATKLQFHDHLQMDLQASQFQQFIIILAMSITLLLAGSCIGYQLYRYHHNMGEVIDIIVQFSNSQINKIIVYWHQVGSHFQKLSKPKAMIKNSSLHNDVRNINDLEVGSESVPEQVEDEKEGKDSKNVNLNQKHKEILVSPEERKNICKTISLILIFVGGLIPAILVIPVSNYQYLQSLTKFENAGFYLFQHFPTTSLASYALLDRYYAEVRPNEYTFDISRFDSLLSNLKIITNYSYITGIDETSEYALKQKNYLFGNPCTYNPEPILKEMRSDFICLNVQNRALTSGITTYIRTIYPRLEAYLTSNSSTISQGQLFDFAAGLTICSIYLLDALTTWQSQFSAMLVTLEEKTIFLSIILGFIMTILHIIVFEIILLARIRKNYQFMREVFTHWVPEGILIQQKIIKHRFYKSGILAAS